MHHRACTLEIQTNAQVSEKKKTHTHTRRDFNGNNKHADVCWKVLYTVELKNCCCWSNDKNWLEEEQQEREEMHRNDLNHYHSKDNEDCYHHRNHLLVDDVNWSREYNSHNDIFSRQDKRFHHFRHTLNELNKTKKSQKEIENKSKKRYVHV